MYFVILALTFLASSTASPLTGRGLPNGSNASDADVISYLTAHNDVRALHGASPLTWKNEPAKKAQEWADACVFEHSHGALGPYGENLAAGTSDFGIYDAVGSWAAEASEYNPADPKASHFTQVVWKATKEVGCAVATCDGIFPPEYGPAQFYVCEYDPAGNVAGEFPENVQV
ncbi:PR-1-like protein [Mycena venus]|uniref:PR-1-like protein n=1 Tax=Mycena venus TaxID=2733690 RepID=A0A8H7CE31_9AGAR|nr:PR-1-like protein [Mycena venus]